MSTAIIDRDDIDFFVYHPEGFGRRTCDWDESVCTDDVTHRIVIAKQPGSDPEPDDVMLFCARHYAVWLVRFATTHCSACPKPLAAHLDYFGPIAGEPEHNNNEREL